MNTLKLLAFLLAVSSVSLGQSFEGKITYKQSYKSKLPNLSDEQLTEMMGATQEYFIKDGDYKSSMNGSYFQWLLYRNKENRLYSKLSNSEFVYWDDGSVNKDEIIKTELNKGVVTVLGRQCDELILTCKSGVQKYYFATDPKVNTKLFEKHKYGNWSVVISNTGTLPLMTIVDNPQLTVESVATEILSSELDDDIFRLPAGAKTAKSTF